VAGQPQRQTGRSRSDRVRTAGPAGGAVRVGGNLGAATAGQPGRWGPSRREPSRRRHVLYWTVREFVREKYLRFLFAEAEDERSQIADLVARVESYLDRECEDDPENDASVVFGGYPVMDFTRLCELIRENVEDEHSPWRGRLSDATVAATAGAGGNSGSTRATTARTSSTARRGREGAKVAAGTGSDSGKQGQHGCLTPRA
jgi:hypothetical protein